MNEELFKKWYSEIYKIGSFDDPYSVCMQFMSWANQNSDTSMAYKKGFMDGALAALESES